MHLFSLNKNTKSSRNSEGSQAFGQDETRKLVTATAEVWDAYLAVSVASMSYVL